MAGVGGVKTTENKIFWPRCVYVQYLKSVQRWYFRKLITIGSLFLGMDSSGGINSAVELIPSELNGTRTR